MIKHLIEALNESGLVKIELVGKNKAELHITEAGGDIYAQIGIWNYQDKVEVEQRYDHYRVAGDINAILKPIREVVMEDMKTKLKAIEYFEFPVERQNNGRYNVSFNYEGEQFLVVDDLEDGIEYKIQSNLVQDEEFAPFNIVERKNEIWELERMIGEAHGCLGIAARPEWEIDLMREDLQTLMSTDEEYVIANYGTNGFITKQSDLGTFNAACGELIESYKEWEKEQVDADSAKNPSEAIAEMVEPVVSPDKGEDFEV